MGAWATCHGITSAGASYASGAHFKEEKKLLTHSSITPAVMLDGRGTITLRLTDEIAPSIEPGQSFGAAQA